MSCQPGEGADTTKVSFSRDLALGRNLNNELKRKREVYMRTLSKVTLMSAFAGILSLGLVGPAAAKFPSKPIDFICATSPGSGAAVWCHLVADHLRKDLKNPVKVQFKSGGSNHEPVVYVANKPNDGHTLLHISASFTGYFNLPHFKYSEKDFDILAVMEQHLYAIAVHADSPWKTYKDWIKAAKKSAV